MKRSNQTTKRDIYSHYGLFLWQECLFCKEEFRREKAYRFQLNANGRWIYSCESCSVSKQHCDERIVVYIKGIRPSKAPMPPPPPMRK